MKRFVVAAAALIIAIGSGPSMAASGPKKTTGTIKGTLAAGSFTSGAPCAAVTDLNGTDAYDTNCTVAAQCSCLTATGLTLTGGFGKGTANASITLDGARATGVGGCAPAYGVMTLAITATKKVAANTITINATGAVCGTPSITAISALGGFTISDASLTTPAEASGSGTFNGTVSAARVTSITLSGSITNP